MEKSRLDINIAFEKYYENVSCRGKDDKILIENLEEISKNKEAFLNKISEIKREELRESKEYLIDRPLKLSDAQKKDIKKENPRETTIQRNFYIKFNNEADSIIGRIPSYEIPLFERRGKGRSSCIDLIGVKNNTLYLLELKRKNTQETLLKSILEVFTYYKYLKIDKIQKELMEMGMIKGNIKKVILAPLVYENGRQINDYNNYKSDFNEIIKKLEINEHNAKINRFNFKFNILIYNNKYEIKEL